MKVAFYTLGCKVNQYESEYMAEILKNAGFEIVSHNDDADYYIVNSCTVTATADQKTRQNIRKFKRNHPKSTVILTGCMPQAFPSEAKSLTEADIILSNKDDNDILKLINEYNKENNKIVEINEHKSGDAFSECHITSFNERIRAFVKIEDGCDRFCSYCIIPKARGRVRSKSLDSLKKEVQTLAKNNIKEIVLVGINLSAYGKGENFNIVDAVKICAADDGIMRVRLGSLEPDHITDEILCELSKIEKFCPQFHISLQSGCDKTLKNMNRHYNSSQYLALCNKIREIFSGDIKATITTDIMVGFHQESEKDFNDSLEFAKLVGFEKAHIFPYSERKGTLASTKGDDVSKEEKERRTKIMIKETDKIRHDYFSSLIGTCVNVLVENQIDNEVFQGYTKNYIPVKFNKNNRDIKIGSEIRIKITELSNDDCCFGEIKD